MAQNKLKPCPFCGENAAYTYWEISSERAIIRCAACLAQMGDELIMFKSEKEAIEAWNKRSNTED